MPKEKLSTTQRLAFHVKEFGADFTTDGSVLTCKLCERVVNGEKKYFVQQHIKSDFHQNRMRRSKSNNQNVCLLTNFLDLSSKESAFNMDLCQMLVECNIPLYKTQHPSFRKFLEKYSKQSVPDQTTLRRNYLQKLYEATLQKIRAEIGDSCIWISLDETTDAKGQYVVNTVIGRMEAEAPSTPFLIGSEIVERTNHTTIAQAFMNSLSLLWPDHIRH